MQNSIVLCQDHNLELINWTEEIPNKLFVRGVKPTNPKQGFYQGRKTN